MTIAEKNQILIDFMGWEETDERGTTVKPPYNLPGESIVKNVFFRKEEVRFHNSFDWIMKVFDKIHRLDSGIYTTLIIYGDFIVVRRKVYGHFNPLVHVNWSEDVTTIELYYKAAVSFVMWWNLNQ